MTNRISYSLATLFFFLVSTCVFTIPVLANQAPQANLQKDPPEKKLLLNGRVWIDKHSKAEGDQFFLTDTFLKGSVTFDGRRFDGLDLKYDLLNDELILRPESHPIIFMNKEMVDSFSLVYSGRDYKIINAGNNPSGILRGYVNVLYNGESALYVKYSKKIYPLAVDGRYDLFVQVQRIYLQRGGELIPVKGKREFLNLLDDRKKEIRHYIKSNRLRLTGKDAGTFVPVLEYYDSTSK
jgi:hypothetical protein